MNAAVKTLVIVGGGSAGWLSAGIIASDHNTFQADGLQVILVESPNVNTIGVGEGTWPTMRNTLKSIGISESEFFKSCDASFKQGSQFINWVDGGETDSYYHPFAVPNGLGQVNLAKFWQENDSNVSFSGAFSSQPHVCDYGLAPKQKTTPEYAAVLNYGYHLNAGKFSDLLKKHCVEKLGVRHVQAHVETIEPCPDSGNILAINTDQGRIEGDLFVDCSGLSALLIGQHYEVPFVDRKSCLFNDSALAVQVDYDAPNTPIATHTLSTAWEKGWVWDIGLPTRRGVGCVYSSEYASDDEAAKALSSYLDLPGQSDFRKLSFRPGHRQEFWHKNCVAVGMSSGFLEPLEASALALVELSAKMISKELPADHEVMPLAAKRYNKRFRYRWDRVIDFLKLHYVLSKREDSNYWIENREESTIPDHLLELLSLWKYQPPSLNDFTEIEEVFPSASYQYILYGMGFETMARSTASRDANESLAGYYFGENQREVNKFLGGLPSNRELVDHIVKFGMPSS